MPSSLLGGLHALRERGRGAVAALGLAGAVVGTTTAPTTTSHTDPSGTLPLPPWAQGSFDDVRRLIAWAIALCLLLVLRESPSNARGSHARRVLARLLRHI